MLEAGISLVAVNLPTLWFLFHALTPESIIRSLRSVLSLSSLRSGSEGNTQPPTNDKAGSTHTLTRSSESSAAKPYTFRKDVEAQKTNVSAIPLQDMRPLEEDGGVHVHNSVVIEHRQK
jgi:hypothetical protein